MPLQGSPAWAQWRSRLCTDAGTELANLAAAAAGRAAAAVAPSNVVATTARSPGGTLEKLHSSSMHAFWGTSAPLPAVADLSTVTEAFKSLGFTPEEPPVSPLTAGMPRPAFRHTLDPDLDACLAFSLAPPPLLLPRAVQIQRQQGALQEKQQQHAMNQALQAMMQQQQQQQQQQLQQQQRVMQPKLLDIQLQHQQYQHHHQHHHQQFLQYQQQNLQQQHDLQQQHVQQQHLELQQQQQQQLEGAPQSGLHQPSSSFGVQWSPSSFLYQPFELSSDSFAHSPSLSSSSSSSSVGYRNKYWGSEAGFKSRQWNCEEDDRKLLDLVLEYGIAGLEPGGRIVLSFPDIAPEKVKAKWKKITKRILEAAPEDLTRQERTWLALEVERMRAEAAARAEEAAQKHRELELRRAAAEKEKEEREKAKAQEKLLKEAARAQEKASKDALKEQSKAAKKAEREAEKEALRAARGVLEEGGADGATAAIASGIGGLTSPHAAASLGRAWVEAVVAEGWSGGDGGTFVPQVGDRVAYFPEGHRRWAAAYPDRRFQVAGRARAPWDGLLKGKSARVVLESAESRPPPGALSPLGSLDPRGGGVGEPPAGAVAAVSPLWWPVECVVESARYEFPAAADDPFPTPMVAMALGLRTVPAASDEASSAEVSAKASGSVTALSALSALSALAAAAESSSSSSSSSFSSSSTSFSSSAAVGPEDALAALASAADASSSSSAAGPAAASSNSSSSSSSGGGGGGGGGKDKGQLLRVLYRPTDLADFIVPWHRVAPSAATGPAAVGAWTVGDECLVRLGGEARRGIVASAPLRALGPEGTLLPRWEGVRVRWLGGGGGGGEGECSFVGEWDLERPKGPSKLAGLAGRARVLVHVVSLALLGEAGASGGRVRVAPAVADLTLRAASPKKRKAAALTSPGGGSGGGGPRGGPSVGPRLSASATKSLLAIFASALETDEAAYLFAGRVTPDIAPDYGTVVPCHVGLDLVASRLRAGFYRQGASLANDLDLIVAHTKHFNGRDAPITAAATSLVARLKKRISKVLMLRC